jgi:hypothetical protein
MLDERPVAAEPGGDRLAGLGMQADLARQRQQLEREIEVDLLGRHALGQRGAVGLFVVRPGALHVRAEAARVQRDRLPGPGIGAELDALRRHAFPVAVLAIAELAREAALGIVGAADEGAEAAELQRQLAGAAGRALARRRAVLAGREDVRPEQIVERIEHGGDPQILDLVDRRDEVAPEVAQHRLPLDLAGRNPVELLFQIGGEIVFDIAPEEGFEECGHQPALVLGHQPLLVDAHIAALAQHHQDGGVGRGPADAEFFQLLDQRGFRIARRRLGEVLRAHDPFHAQAVAARHRRQPLAVLVGLVVAAFLIEAQEAVEAHHRPGGAKGVALRVVALRRNVDGGALELGAFHLAGHGALPDQLVERGLFGIEIGLRTRSGKRNRSVGRIASWASWAFLALVR